MLKINYWNWALDPGKTTSASLYLQSLLPLMAILAMHRKQPQVATGRGINNIISEIISMTTIIMLLLITISFVCFSFSSPFALWKASLLSCVVFHSKSHLEGWVRAVCKVSASDLETIFVGGCLTLFSFVTPVARCSSFLLFRWENLWSP